MSNGNTYRVPLSPTENLAIGALGGAFETCLQMPLITYKFCSQEGRSFPKSLPGWYRGVAVQAGTVAPITAIQFAVNGVLQRTVLSLSNKDNNATLSDVQMMCTAAGAGAISALVYSPVDLITIQQQKLELDPMRTTRRLYQRYGLSGIFRGLASTAVREAVYTGGYLGLAPIITAHLVGSSDESGVLKDKPLAASILGAFVAGTFAALLTHPVDTAKTCVQSDMTGNTWATATQAIPKLLKEGGVKSLYRGAAPRTVRLCGAFFVCLMARDMAVNYKTSNHIEQLNPLPMK